MAVDLETAKALIELARQGVVLEPKKKSLFGRLMGRPTQFGVSSVSPPQTPEGFKYLGGKYVKDPSYLDPLEKRKLASYDEPIPADPVTGQPLFIQFGGSLRQNPLITRDPTTAIFQQLAQNREKSGQLSTRSFNSIEEAEAANLEPGTEITINGRRAVIE